MEKKLLVILVVFFSFKSYSQVFFEEGYFIDNENKKVNCLIKNKDWLKNPTSFEYKLTEETKTIKITIDEVKEFDVFNHSKYIRVNVKIDRSSSIIDKLSNLREPDFKEEKLFLKVLVEGKASLYEYIDNNLRRYFYKKENLKIEQLVFKSYITNDNKYLKNKRYQKQLLDNLKCNNFMIKDVSKLNYYKDDLVDFFVEFSKCNEASFIDYTKRKKRNLLNFSLRPRIETSSLEFTSNSVTGDFDLGRGLIFGVGLEIEYIFPFNKTEWSVILEPTYKVYQTNTSIPGFEREFNKKINYKFLEFPLGFRRYFFLNKNSSIFINTLLVLKIELNSISEFNSTYFGSVMNFGFGFGYKFKNKYSIEVRGFNNREFGGNGLSVLSKYKSFSLIFGYTLF
jgi:hypothetical protein